MLLIPTSNFFYWLVLNALIGSSVSSLFPYLMVAFSMKSSTPEKTAQLSGLAQTGGYVFAAFGPILFGYSKSLFHSWTPAHSYAPGLNHHHGHCPLSGGKSRSYFITIVWLEDSSSGLFVLYKKN